jgi:uncharacterized membrane protein YdbT with pleckstrin-like domain
MKPWIEGNLSTGERLIVLARPHWFWFFTPRRILLYGLATWLIYLSLRDFGSDPSMALKLLMIVVSVFCAWAAYSYLDWLTHELAVTDQRIVIKAGILGRTVRQFKLPNVESVGVDQSVLGRALNYGTVTVYGNGNESMKMITIADPWAVQKATEP